MAKANYIPPDVGTTVPKTPLQIAFERAKQALDIAGEVPVMPSDLSQVGGRHYLEMTVQPWAALEAWLSPEGFADYLRGTAIHYLARAGRKEGTDDVRKARHVLDKLLEVQERRDLLRKTSPHSP